MGLANIQVYVELTQITCGGCGGTYAISERVRLHKEEKGEGWHCPYCKIGWGYYKSAVQIEKEAHQRTLARLNDEIAERDRLARKLKRVDKGVCPHCKRTFRNLARHMDCKHKEKK